ncbi:MAG: alpha-glucan family phosphorylase [Proteobacteria bacterium]|nr:alpha-glucan family phosphorylase [Pseudomonadota bacterium]NIS70154.1 alpha-glucan family phosphorylase [Pseudomonadota bacterium]
MIGGVSLAPRHLRTVAYFSMEVGLDPAMPTYSGGLGVLAGDTLRAAADLAIPMVGVTLLHRKGYFRQHLDARGNQSEDPFEWYPEESLEPLRPRISLTIEGRSVQIRAWLYRVVGVSGHAVPVYFLDTQVPGNGSKDQALTDYLYGGDARYRLCQEAILGFGGVAMLQALGYRNVKAYHMNEGHSALLVLALLERERQNGDLENVNEADIEAVRQRCVFTTHTPVPAGHDQFSMDLVQDVLGKERAHFLATSQCCLVDTLNMTYLALFFSRYINGVSHRHEEISQTMFPNYPINSITNGVHALNWTSPPFRRLYDRHIPEWRHDNLYLRYAISIPLEEIIEAHAEAKRELVAEVERRNGVRLRPEVMTLGFARRATAYKRGDLLFSDLERLKSIAHQAGSLQIVFGGKAHPKDEGGQAVIRTIFEAARSLGDKVPVVYLEDFDMVLAKYIYAGVDLWLNTPQKPREASGTSGMKAALNGVPSLSVLDGWWIEGHVEGVTGWSIGDSWEGEVQPSAEIASLYDKLESVILPMYYKHTREYAEVMRSAIALNGSFFNAQRMMVQYLKNAYLATTEI